MGIDELLEWFENKMLGKIWWISNLFVEGGGGGEKISNILY